MSQLNARLKQAVEKANVTLFDGVLKSADLEWRRTGWRVAKYNRRAWRTIWKQAHPKISLIGSNDDASTDGGSSPAGGRPRGSLKIKGSKGATKGPSRRHFRKKKRSSKSEAAVAYAAFAQDTAKFQRQEYLSPHLIPEKAKSFGLGPDAFILNLPKERYMAGSGTASLSVFDAQ